MSAPMIVGPAPAKVGHRQTPPLQRPPPGGRFALESRVPSGSLSLDFPDLATEAAGGQSDMDQLADG